MIAFTPFSGQHEHVLQFVHELFKAGGDPFIAGTRPTRVRMLVPAPVITNADIDEVMHIIKSTLISYQKHHDLY